MAHQLQYLAEAAVDHPFAIAVWQERLYWSDWEHDHIRSCLKRSGKQTRQIVKGSHSDFFGLTIYHPAMMPQVIAVLRGLLWQVRLDKILRKRRVDVAIFRNVLMHVSEK